MSLPFIHFSDILYLVTGCIVLGCTVFNNSVIGTTVFNNSVIGTTVFNNSVIGTTVLS